MSKRLPKQAEIAAERWLIENYKCVITHRAIKTKFARQDLFGGDVIGKDKEGRLYVVQVTTGGHSAVSKRKKKLEEIPWIETDRVFLLRMIVNKKSRPYEYLFDVRELKDGRWNKLGQQKIPNSWLKTK